MHHFNLASRLAAGILLVAAATSTTWAATQYTYDALNRLTQVRYDDGRSISYTYDAAGNMLSTTTTAPAVTSLNFVERPDTGSGWNLRVTVNQVDATGNHGTFNFGNGVCSGTLTYKGKDLNQDYVFKENHVPGTVCNPVCDIVIARDGSYYNERCFGNTYRGNAISPVNRQWIAPAPTAQQLDQVLGLTQVDVGGFLYVSTIDFKPSSLNIAVDVTSPCRYGLVYNAPPYSERPNAGEWSVEVPTAGTYRIRVSYSAELPRPVSASIDGAVFNSNALGGVNGTWCSTPSMDEVIGEVTLTPGVHTLRLARASVFPHLQRIVLQRTSGVPALVNPATGRRYEVITCGSWTNCRSVARALGGDLATIRNQAENDWLIANILSQARTEYGLWIGLTDAAQEGVWRWSSGEPVTFTNWRIGEPNNFYIDGRAESYVHIWKGILGTSYLPGVWNDIVDEPSGSIITQAIVEYPR